MDDNDIVLLRPADQVKVEGVIRCRADRIERIGDKDVPGLFSDLFLNGIEVGKIIILRKQAVGYRFGAAQLWTD